MSRVFSVVVAIAGLLIAGSLFASSPQQPVFHAGVPTVSIYATVVDQTGRLAANLTKDDFEVYDNGKRQDLTLFANDVQPITLVMMLDRSQSMEPNFTLVRDAAEQFVTNLLPQDRVRLGSFSDRIQIDPETFTSDKDELIRILRNNLLDAGTTPLWNATAMAMTALAREEGRRVVLLFTDGHDGPDFATRETNVSLGQVRARAAAEGVMVYAIGLANACNSSKKVPSTVDRVPETLDSALFQRRPGGGRGGTTRIPGGSRGVPRLPGMPGRGRGGIPRGPGPFGLPPRSTVPEKPVERAGAACVETKPDPNLRTLTNDGGGGYFELKGTENLPATFARIAEELHHQYLLAYTVPAFDGKTHQIDVRVKEKNMSVRARKSYVAAASK
jgi:VWFA-related protein